MLTEAQQIEMLVRLLRSLEWSWGMPDDTVPHCIDCGYEKPVDGNSGHSWQCKLAEALDHFEGKFL